jgi:hypothetical protein
LSDLVSKAVKEAGCRITRRNRNELAVYCPAKMPESLYKAIKGYGFQLFSSSPALYRGATPKFGHTAPKVKGRDYWFQRFRGTDAQWREYLRTGVWPTGGEASIRSVKLTVRL